MVQGLRASLVLAVVLSSVGWHAQQTTAAHDGLGCLPWRVLARALWPTLCGAATRPAARNESGVEVSTSVTVPPLGHCSVACSAPHPPGTPEHRR